MVQNRNLMEPTVDNIPEFKLSDFFLGLNAKSVLSTFRMPPMPSLFIEAVKDICTINTFELLNILFSEVNCLHFGFTTRLFPDTTNDLSIYEVLKLFHR